MQHRDSLGSNRIIHPGAVNWMVAGKGITHSERTSADVRRAPHELFGIQTWVALPEAHEDDAPSFAHHARHDLPEIEDAGVSLRLILGRAFGETAPVKVFSELFYADVALKPAARAPLPDDHEDRGLYVVEGAVAVAGQTFDAGRMLVFRPGDRITVAGGEHGARLILLGGGSSGPATSGGTSSPRARSGSRPPRRPGARPTGATAASTCRRTTATSSLRRRTRNPFAPLASSR